MAKRFKKEDFLKKPLIKDYDKLRLIYLSLIFSLILTALSLPYEVFFYFKDIKAGHKSDKNIVALKNYFLPDYYTLDKKKIQARKTSPQIIDYDPSLTEKYLEELSSNFAQMRGWTKLFPYENYKNNNEIANDGYEKFKLIFKISSFPYDSFINLWSLSFSKEVESKIAQILSKIYEKGYLREESFQQERRVIKRVLPSYEEIFIKDPDFIFNKNDLKSYIKSLLESDKSELATKHQKTIGDAIFYLIQPNISYNIAETEIRENVAIRKIEPNFIVIRSGELLVSKGEIVSPQIYDKITAIKKEELKKISLINILITFLIYFFFSVLFYNLSVASIKKFRYDYKSILFNLTVISLTFLSLGVFYLFGILISYDYNIHPELFVLFVPFALSGMLLRLFLNSETAIISLFYAVIIIGNIFPQNYYIILYFLGSSLVGINIIGRNYTRTDILRSSFKISLFNILFVLVMFYFTERKISLDATKMIVIGSVIISGFLSTTLLIMLTPIFEYIFKYTTTIKLIELSNLDHPLLKELMMKAPGTYNHSMLIANMVESAASAIKVNPILARVSAYYHDIGKIKMPEFFIENQFSGYNKHEELSPSMSYLIVTSHVKEGIEIARQYNLGDQIIDAISQHHGTRVVTFFYAKALKADPNVSEENFRYPGPKPKTREVALIMMADAVEAASRVLDEPTAGRIKGLVRKIINDIFLDGQLDECELTLKDLTLVTESFTRTLMGVYHQRIDYPDIKTKKENGKK
ncbi:MAG: HDIG domain-containing protein [Proteobacteria bacterium]|nr:HDIG domain-containing protein [Pseudomonadota bacterium]